MSEGGGPVVTGAMLSSMQSHMGAGGAVEGLAGNILFKSFPSYFTGLGMGGKGLIGLMSGVKENMLGQLTATPTVGGMDRYTQGFEGGLFKGGQSGGQGMAA